MFECFADGAVGAWVGGARVDCRLTVISSVAGPAQAGEIPWARLVSAHGTVGARVGVAVRVLDQTLQAGKSLGTVTPFNTKKRYNKYILLLGLFQNKCHAKPSLE